MPEEVSFGRWLKDRRKALDLTQQALGERVGCAGETIRRFEAGRLRPSHSMAERLATALEIPDDDRLAFVRIARRHPTAARQVQPDPPLDARLPERLLAPPGLPTLRGYVLGPAIGAGNFGVVYRASQASVNRNVAIKAIHSQYADHPEFIRQFDVEAQLVARLEHPYIVPLYDYWREPGGAYLVMRYLHGGTLQQVLRAGPLGLDRWRLLLEQIASALTFAHRHGVIHRDVKPANILFDGEGRAFLSDFGIAGVLTSVNRAWSGQPYPDARAMAYVAPEQLHDETSTPHTDIYSFAVLLYEALTGRYPFVDTPLAARATTPLPPVERYWSDLPPALAPVLQRASAPQARERYDDIEAFVRDVLAVFPGMPSLLSPSWPDQTRPAMENVGDGIGTVTNPYKGLRPFGEADAADFFGREALTQHVLERLAEDTAVARFLAIVGPSGSGKSSVVRAGLLPALRRGGLPGSDAWFVVELTPGDHPVEELEAALLRIAVNPPSSLLDQLLADERGLTRAVKRVLPADESTELVLIIDQFEELWTLVENEATRVHVLKSLEVAVRDARSRLRVVVTLRADFYDRPLLYPEFGALLHERTAVVLPMTPEELARAVVGPAERTGLAVERDLVATIVADVGKEPGTMPLLQYALMELWERRDGRTLTLAAYHASRGVLGALARRADKLFDGLTADEQVVTRQLFLHLVTPGEGTEDTRRRVRRSDLPGEPETVERVIERYGRYRLLTFDRDPITREPTVEVAHEALIRNWGRLREWLQSSRDDLRIERRLAAAAAEWASAARDTSFLASGTRLLQFEMWAQTTTLTLTTLERVFLDASLDDRARQAVAEQERQQRELATTRHYAQRMRRRAVYLTSALALAVVATLAALAFARSERSTFVQSERLRLAAEANHAVDESGIGELAALLALRSLSIGYTPQADAALVRSQTLGIPQQEFAHHGAFVLSVAVSPDGRYLATGSGDGTDGTAKLWDLTSGTEVHHLAGQKAHITDIAFSPDGRYVITASGDERGDGTVKLWEHPTGKLVETITIGSFSRVAISPDGNALLYGTFGGSMGLMDVRSKNVVRWFVGHSSSVTGIDFSHDGAYALTSSYDGTARLWNVQSGEQLQRYSHSYSDSPLSAVAFSPDDTLVLTGGRDGIARLWNRVSGQEIRQFTGHSDDIYAVAFSPAKTYVLTGSSDHTARLWETSTGEQVQVFGHRNWIPNVAFTPDGSAVLTASGSAWLWETQVGIEPRVVRSNTLPVSSVAYTPDGQQLLIASDQARIWPAHGGRQPRSLALSSQSVARFSPDGKWLALAGQDGTVRVWQANGTLAERLFAGPSDAVRAIAFSPDSRRLLTSSEDGTVNVWDVASGAVVSTRTLSYTDRRHPVAFSPDGQYVVTLGFDRIVHLWKSDTGQEIRQFKGHTDLVFAAAFSPDGKYLLTGSQDKTARLWETATGREVQRFVGHVDAISGVAYSPDGRYVVTGSWDHTARLWDTSSGVLVRNLVGHTSSVMTVAFSPDGSHLVTGSEDETARVWRVDIQEVIQLICSQLVRDLSAEERTAHNITDTSPTCPK